MCFAVNIGKAFYIEQLGCLLLIVLQKVCLLTGFVSLTMLTGKGWCFTQFITEMAGWLLLIFLICLHNQLSSIHSIISADV